MKLTFIDTSVRGAFSFSSLCQIHNEQSFFFFRFSEENCTRAPAAKPQDARNEGAWLFACLARFT